MTELEKRGRKGPKKRNNPDDEYTIVTVDQTRQVPSKLIHA
jgi:hypothetical protein